MKFWMYVHYRLLVTTTIMLDRTVRTAGKVARIGRTHLHLDPRIKSPLLCWRAGMLMESTIPAIMWHKASQGCWQEIVFCNLSCIQLYNHQVAVAALAAAHLLVVCIIQMTTLWYTLQNRNGWMHCIDQYWRCYVIWLYLSFMPTVYV